MLRVKRLFFLLNRGKTWVSFWMDCVSLIYFIFYFSCQNWARSVKWYANILVNVNWNKRALIESFDRMSEYKELLHRLAEYVCVRVCVCVSLSLCVCVLQIVIKILNVIYSILFTKKHLCTKYCLVLFFIIWYEHITNYIGASCSFV